MFHHVRSDRWYIYVYITYWKVRCGSSRQEPWNIFSQVWMIETAMIHECVYFWDYWYICVISFFGIGSLTMCFTKGVACLRLFTFKILFLLHLTVYKMSCLLQVLNEEAAYSPCDNIYIIRSLKSNMDHKIDYFCFT